MKPIERAIAVVGTQVKLAKRLGCSQQVVSKLKTGQIGVSAAMAIKIERATGIPRHVLRPDLWSAPEAARQ